VPDGGRDWQAKKRAERIAWRERSSGTTRASRSLNERLGEMNGGGATLDRRLWHHAEASRAWHLKWDDLPRSG
jgi:hypothetical protein